jgi:cobalt-zinc-cadmium efflux system outer membrane protein
VTPLPFRTIAFVCALGALAAGARAQDGAPLTLDAAIERALAANPAIVAARERHAIGLAGVAVAAERLNPEARVELEREAPTEAYSVAVPLELGGKRAKRIAAGEAAVRTSDAELARTIAETRAGVRRAYYARLIAESRLNLLTELQTLSERARDAAGERFAAGSAPRLELLQAELALAEARNQATAARGQVTAARVELNALLALPLDRSAPLAGTLDATAVTPPEAAVARARQASTELAVLERRLDEQQAKILVARSLRVPDLTPEATLTHGSEPEFDYGWRVAVAVTLPIFTTHRAAVDLEQATLVQLTAERDAALARITGEVTAAAALAAADRELYERYRSEIVPQTTEVERLAEESYRLGETGISALLQALQASRDVRLRSLQAADDLQTALAELERAIGAPLP